MERYVPNYQFRFRSVVWVRFGSRLAQGISLPEQYFYSHTKPPLANVTYLRSLHRSGLASDNGTCHRDISVYRLSRTTRMTNEIIATTMLDIIHLTLDPALGVLIFYRTTPPSSCASLAKSFARSSLSKIVQSKPQRQSN